MSSFLWVVFQSPTLQVGDTRELFSNICSWRNIALASLNRTFRTSKKRKKKNRTQRAELLRLPLQFVT